MDLKCGFLYHKDHYCFCYITNVTWWPACCIVLTRQLITSDITAVILICMQLPVSAMRVCVCFTHSVIHDFTLHVCLPLTEYINNVNKLHLETWLTSLLQSSLTTENIRRQWRRTVNLIVCIFAGLAACNVTVQTVSCCRLHISCLFR